MTESTTPPKSKFARFAKILALDLFLVVLLLETVPRLVSIPGLTLAELNPAELEDVRARRSQPHPYLSYSLLPGWTSNPKKVEQASHNQLGFRGREPAIPKPAGVFRILCIGGSSTYGSGPTKDAWTYPAKLQDQLRGRGARTVETVNLGVKGWTSTESLINLCLRGVELEPDLVVVYHATNDALAAMWPEPNWDQSHFRSTWTDVQKSGLEKALERSRTYLVARAYLTNYRDRLLDQNHYTIVNYDGGYVEPDKDREVPERGVRTFVRNLSQITTIARASEAEVVFVRQAFHPGEGLNDNPHSGAVRKRVMGRMLAAQDKLAAELSVPVIDTATNLEALAQAELDKSGKQRIFTNNVHLTNKGAGELARLLSLELLERNLVPR